MRTPAPDTTTQPAQGVRAAAAAASALSSALDGTRMSLSSLGAVTTIWFEFSADNSKGSAVAGTGACLSNSLASFVMSEPGEGLAVGASWPFNGAERMTAEATTTARTRRAIEPLSQFRHIESN